MVCCGPCHLSTLDGVHLIFPSGEREGGGIERIFAEDKQCFPGHYASAVGAVKGNGFLGDERITAIGLGWRVEVLGGGCTSCTVRVGKSRRFSLLRASAKSPCKRTNGLRNIVLRLLAIYR